MSTIIRNMTIQSNIPTNTPNVVDTESTGDISIIFENDENIYKPAQIMFENWETTPYPGSDNSSRTFIKGMSTKFTVRVKFVTEQARAASSAREYNEYRENLQNTGANLLTLKMFYKDNNAPIGILRPDSFYVGSYYVDYKFHLDTIDNNIAFIINSAIPTYSTVKAVNQASSSTLTLLN